MIPFLFAASLNVTTPANVAPNRRNILTLKGAALLAGSKPGKYKISAHMPGSAEEGGRLVGEHIPSTKISPPVLRLRENKNRSFVANIPVGEGYSGPVYLCIVSAEPPKQTVGITMIARSCYRRIVLPK